MSAKSKTSQSRFELKYRDCRKIQCKNRELDESCILKCISINCYNKIYVDYILEFGELNYDKKSELEGCFNKNLL